MLTATVRHRAGVQRLQARLRAAVRGVRQNQPRWLSPHVYQQANDRDTTAKRTKSITQEALIEKPTNTTHNNSPN